MRKNYTGAARVNHIQSLLMKIMRVNISLLGTTKCFALLDNALIIRHNEIALFPSQNHLSA